MPDHPVLLGQDDFHARLGEIVASKGAPPWSVRIALSDHVMGTLICQAPGHVNDLHYHLEDEWWVILQGEIDWELEGRDAAVEAKKGDFVFVPKDHFHHIKPKGSEPTLRLAISKTGEPHRHER